MNAYTQDTITLHPMDEENIVFMLDQANYG